MTTLTRKQIGAMTIEEMHKHFGYEPYTGGAGPTEEQRKQLVAVLKTALEAIGLQVFEITMGEDDLAMPGLRVGRMEFTYDRWGYCDEYGEYFDQASLYSVVKRIVFGGI